MKIIKFTATWCADCIVMKPVWHKWFEQLKGIDIVEYDFDDDLAGVKEYNVMRVPTVIVLDNDNQEIDRFEGMQNLQTLKDVTDKLMN